MFTILIGTCDKYNFLWNDFISLFNKYWDHSLSCEKYFLSETISPQYDGFKTLLPGKIPYSKCLKYALNNINSDYILWLQDDYYFRKTITKQKFEYYMQFIQDNNVDRLGICENSKLYSQIHAKDNIYRLNQNSQYTISMQASIWKKDFLSSCLGPVENPWEFELNGSIRLNLSKKHNIYQEIQYPPWYKECMTKGKYNQNYKIIQTEENL